MTSAMSGGGETKLVPKQQASMQFSQWYNPLHKAVVQFNA